MSPPEVTAELLCLLRGCAEGKAQGAEMVWGESRRLREAPAVPEGGSGLGGAGSWWTQTAGIPLNGGENGNFKIKDTQL